MLVDDVVQMSFTEEEIRRAADMKMWIEARIAEHEADIERLKQMLLIIDGVLRQSSFKPAIAVAKPPVTEGRAEGFTEVRPLKRVKDGLLLGNAYISPNRLVIIPSSDLKLTADTPPFRSFFLNRVLDGMKAKDNEAVKEGKMRPDQVLSYTIDEDEGRIAKIAVENYSSQTRLNEIISTVTWSFTRMLEKSK